MHAFLSNATAALLAFHMILGCCWHHAHGRAEERGMNQSSESLDSHECHLEDGCCGSNVPADHSGRHDPHECQGNSCSFLSSSNQDDGSSSQPFQAFFTPRVDDQHTPAGAGSEQFFFAAGELLSPVRLHLAHQVMLI
jgi:hypothetical protein